MAVSVVHLTGKDAAGARWALQQAASEIEGRGEVIRGIASILGGNCLVIASSSGAAAPSAAPSVTQELENLKRLKDANAISVFDYDDAKKALLAKLGK
jgi:hypothetical protein